LKIKTDFVTNSSSSSFVVMGRFLEADNISDETIQKLADEKNLNVDDLKNNILEYIDYFIEGSDLEYSYGDPNGYDDVMVGIEYTKMSEVETLGQFRKRVQDQLKAAFGVDDKPGHIQAGWVDN